MARRMPCPEVIMGFSEPIENALHEVEENHSFPSSRFLVIPLREDQPPTRTIPFRRPRAKILTMPLREYPSARPGISKIGYCGHALEYWPRGYPSHDDL
jgi:hypothetical protein